MKTYFIGIITAFCLVNGFTQKVHLTLTTNDDITHNATIILKDKDRVVLKEVNAGTISSNKNKSVDIKIKRKGYMQIISRMNKVNGILFSTPDISYMEIPDPKNFEVDLKSNVEFLDDNASSKSLCSSFGKLGVDIAGGMKDIDFAFENILGSLVVVVDDTAKHRHKILFSLVPGRLGVRIIKPYEIEWKDTHEEGEINISGTSANKLNDSIPLLSKFGYNFDTNKVYHLKWKFTGFGQHLKPEDEDRWPTHMLMELLFDDLEKIKIFIEEQGAKVFYINQVNVLITSELYVKEAKEIGNDEDKLVNIIFGDKSFTCSNKEEQQKKYKNQVINFWGNEYSFKFSKDKIYTGRYKTIDYKIKYSIYNLNRSECFAPDIFE